MALSTGQVLNNRYRIDSLMGEGGFGAVYKAWDTKLNGPCALKENFDTSPQAEKQFAREASMLFNLRHPSLPMVFDYFSVPGQGLYLVMVYVDGEDLQQVLNKRQGPLAEEVVLPWIKQVCDALSYLHQQEPPIIHRDIKPANIKITPQGQAVLVDFGIAKVYDPKLKTTIGARAVTPGYSPPEQYGRGSTDARTDIYALGATLYTLLTGSEPPDSLDLLTSGERQATGVKLLNPKVTSIVDAAIQQAMQLDRERRFQTVDGFKTALLSVSPTIPAAFHRAFPETKVVTVVEAPERAHPGKKPRFKLWQIISLVVLVCAVGAALVFLLAGSGEDQIEAVVQETEEIATRIERPEEEGLLPPEEDWFIPPEEEVSLQPGEEGIHPPEEEVIAPMEEQAENRQPEVQRYEIPVQGDPFIGPANAPVTIIEFGDYECRECQRWQFDYFPQLKEIFGEDFRFFFLDFPQDRIHPNAFTAAMATNCAMEQDRFWEYRNHLFTWEHGLGLPAYYIYAEDLGLNLDAFSACFEGEYFHQEIIEDMELGGRLGISIIPTFFINGIRVEGVPPFDRLVEIIEGELGRR